MGINDGTALGLICFPQIKLLLSMAVETSAVFLWKNEYKIFILCVYLDDVPAWHVSHCAKLLSKNGAFCDNLNSFGCLLQNQTTNFPFWKLWMWIMMDWKPTLHPKMCEERHLVESLLERYFLQTKLKKSLNNTPKFMQRTVPCWSAKQIVPLSFPSWNCQCQKTHQMEFFNSHSHTNPQPPTSYSFDPGPQKLLFMINFLTDYDACSRPTANEQCSLLKDRSLTWWDKKKDSKRKIAELTNDFSSWFGTFVLSSSLGSRLFPKPCQQSTCTEQYGVWLPTPVCFRNSE